MENTQGVIEELDAHEYKGYTIVIIATEGLHGFGARFSVHRRQTADTFTETVILPQKYQGIADENHSNCASAIGRATQLTHEWIDAQTAD
jgi:hypothetical protein